MLNAGSVHAVATELLTGFLRRTHLCKPSDLADVVADQAEASLQATDVVLYLVNYEQSALAPVPARRSPQRSAQAVEGTMAGRAFTSGEALSVLADQPSHRRLWLPLLDGTDRLGTLELTIPADDDLPQLVALCERYAHLVAQALVTKHMYGDVFDQVQRSQPMTIGAELLWAVLPPLTYATDGLVVSAMLEPTYDNGGDAFDYAVNDDVAHLPVRGLGNNPKVGKTYCLKGVGCDSVRIDAIGSTYIRFKSLNDHVEGANRLITFRLAKRRNGTVYLNRAGPSGRLGKVRGPGVAKQPGCKGALGYLR